MEAHALQNEYKGREGRRQTSSYKLCLQDKKLFLSEHVEICSVYPKRHADLI